MIYRYLIDGVVIDEPEGWDSLVTNIKRDRTLKALLKSQEVTLVFRGTGYTALFNKLNTFGFNGKATLEIQRSFDGNIFTNFYTGTLFTKYYERDEKDVSISSKVEDDSYYAKINNNRNLDCLPHVGFAKNSTPAVPIVIDVAPIQFIQFFNPSTGTYYPILSGTDKERSCAAYRVYDIFKFLIDFMSDGTVDFDSTLFDTGGQRAGMMFTYGLVVDTVQAGLSDDAFERNFPKISFENFFKEVDRICNIGFYVDNSAGRPKIWIEEQDALFENTPLLTVDNIDELKTSTYQNQLYSKLKIGTSQNLLSWTTNDNFPETIDFLGPKIEEFNLLGISNIDSTLDLTGDYVISSNIIADGVVNVPNDQWDDHLFFIDCEYVSGVTWAAVKTNTLTGTPPPYYYNQAFMNDQITTRYLGFVPNSIANYLGNNDYKFQAEKTDQVSRLNAGEISHIQFQDDSTGGNFNEGGAYDSTSLYIVPQSGAFTFAVNLEFLFVWQAAVGQVPILTADISAYINEYDPTGATLLQSYFVAGASVGGNYGALPIHSNIRGARTIVTSIGNKIDVRTVTTLSPTPDGTNLLRTTTHIMPNSFFSCTSTVTGGGTYQTYDPADYSVLLHKFKYPISETQFDAIQNNIKGYLTFSRAGQVPRIGWIETIKMDHKSGVADITLTSSVKVNQ